MFLHTLRIERITPSGEVHAVPIAQLDNFSMRNFTNDAIFDDTLPVADGTLEAGSLVPLDRLRDAMVLWFRRKQYLQPGDTLRITPTTFHRGETSKS
ncbi:hypothetical protein [Terriglobus aquaticus]|uniref:Uncharacterized protein n=1 Tax=Terriglobus aquaticus TaxID=940139 RepID=A0ABW9KI97_9BACT|nr:hypothetical protein [Terriglobus aquaticus]